MITLIPKSLRAHTACSLEDPHPKLSLATIIVPVSNGFIFNIKSLLILRSFVVLRSPGSRYLKESNKNGPKPDFLIDFKYCFGIIASVSILLCVNGIACPLIELFFIYKIYHVAKMTFYCSNCSHRRTN